MRWSLASLFGVCTMHAGGWNPPHTSSMHCVEGPRGLSGLSYSSGVATLVVVFGFVLLHVSRGTVLEANHHPLWSILQDCVCLKWCRTAWSVRFASSHLSFTPDHTMCRWACSGSCLSVFWLDFRRACLCFLVGEVYLLCSLLYSLRFVLQHATSRHLLGRADLYSSSIFVNVCCMQ